MPRGVVIIPPPFALSLSKGCSSFQRRQKKSGPSTSSGRTVVGSFQRTVISVVHLDDLLAVAFAILSQVQLGKFEP
jgi:hypothetical protein